MTAEPPAGLRSPATRIEQALRALGEGHVEEAEALLEAVGPSACDDARSAALGMVHLAAGRHAAARSAFRTAVALGDCSPVTLLNLALAEDWTGDTARARLLMRELHARLPDWDEPLLRLAESLRRAGEASAAEAAYERTLEINPRRPEALISLAAMLLGRGEAERAQMLMLRCCAIAPDRAEAWDTLGISLMRTNDAAAAEAVFAEAQRRDPRNVGFALRKVEASMAAGNGEYELARLEVASNEDPLDCVLLTARGALLNLLGRPEEAVDILEVAVALDPEAPAPAAALAMVLIRCNRIGQAITALERALALAPEDVNLRNNRAAALVRVHRQNEAREELEKLVAEHGEQPGFLCNLTNALVSLGLQDEGVAVARRAIELDPGSNLAWRTLSNALPYQDGIGGAELLHAYRRAGETIPRAIPAPLPNLPDRHRRIRVGLLSPTLKTHPVGWLTIAGFETLDPEAFEIICLGQLRSDDAVQRRFNTVASGWHVVDRASVHAGARIRELGIDVIVDLSGYGDQGFMTLCAERLAPVQVKWVGSQNHSSGLAEMDWFITDRWETPPECERFYSERLLVMPDGYVCYSPPAYAPEVAPPPFARNDGRITFGCYNNLAKVTARVIEVWAAILARVPGSLMVLKCLQFNERATRDRVQAAFEAHGIEPARIALRGSSPHRDLLAQYGDIDIVLDPFPYSGGLTTCEALWMGVPTVALPGETFASRHSTSHLCNVGLADWVAADLDDYQRIAIERAADPATLATLRAGLRARVKASPLCDAPRFGRNLGAALRGAWTDWCAQQPGDRR
jgi:protein O-GlcNAc transferase